ncbi:MAG: DNA-binding domain-containing protein [Mangrovicoccus sp.]
MSVTQSQFTEALLSSARPAPEGLQDPAGRPAKKRFDVYRNNVAVSLTEALRSGFPIIRKLVGDEFFDAMAGVYLRNHPPKSPLMMFYGEEMPGFLRSFPPAKNLPYLPDMARLEFAMRQAYHASDAPIFDPRQLNALGGAAMMSARFTFAPATQLLRSAYPIHAIWRRNTVPDTPKPEMRPENILITRPGFDPLLTPLDAPAAVFTKALIEGSSLSQAALRAEAVQGDFDLTQSLGQLFAAQALSSLAN